MAEGWESSSLLEETPARDSLPFALACVKWPVGGEETSVRQPTSLPKPANKMLKSTVIILEEYGDVTVEGLQVKESIVQNEDL